MTLVERLHSVISYRGTRVLNAVQDRQANVVVAHAFDFHPIGELKFEGNGVVVGGISASV